MDSGTVSDGFSYEQLYDLAIKLANKIPMAIRILRFSEE